MSDIVVLAKDSALELLEVKDERKESISRLAKPRQHAQVEVSRLVTLTTNIMSIYHDFI